jgi:glycine betaine catabolism B
MLRALDRLLNDIPMYRITLILLGILAACAALLSVVGTLPYPPLALTSGLIILFLTTYLVNAFFDYVYDAPSNPESTAITALILFFVMAPATSYLDAALLVLAGSVAVASKYVIAYRKQHLINPAAFGALIVGIPTGAAIWWVGTPSLFIATAVLGFCLLRKLHRFSLALIALAVSLIVAGIHGVLAGDSLIVVLLQALFSGPVLFFVTFMLTEPLTAPGTTRGQLIYGALVGAGMSWPFTLGGLYTTPELALALGNIGAFFTGMRRRLLLTLTAVTEVARDTYDFAFTKPKGMSFIPGQYLEWTIPHAPSDTRGIRRYFTIASAPEEAELHIGVKIGEQHSSFKDRLKQLAPGALIAASTRSGSFTLPTDSTAKLLFIAGGIGITPFRSMVAHLQATGATRDITLIYAARTYADAAYADFFEAATACGITTHYILSEQRDALPEGAHAGVLDAALLAKLCPDARERIAYLSGPNAMVQAYKQLLRATGARAIKTDYFPGF